MRPRNNPRSFVVEPTKKAARQADRTRGQSLKDPDTLIADAAAELGWRVGRGLVRRMKEDTDQIDFTEPGFLVSRTVWFAYVATYEIAVGLTKYLSDQPADDDQRRLNYQLNPRFGIVPASELTGCDRMAIMPAIDDLASNHPLDYWGEIARPLLSKVRQFYSRNGIGEYHGDRKSDAGSSSQPDAVLAGTPKKKKKFTKEEKKALETKARKYLSLKPKAARDDLARHLKVGSGTASNLVAWKKRQLNKRMPRGTKLPSGKRIGLEVAIDQATVPTHYSVKQQQEERDAQIDALAAEQAAEARIDGVEIELE